MTATPDPAEISRMVEIAEANLRRLGFTERTIKARRKTTRAVITNHLLGKAAND